MNNSFAHMEHLAQRIVGELLPYCHQVEVAGSIRRRRQTCNDIDLVAIPKDFAAARARVLANTHPIENGPRILSVNLANGVQLDVFWAHCDIPNLIDPTTPSNWGSVLLCRTGSKEHNKRLCIRAQRMRLHWDPLRGLMKDGQIIASRTEHDIFAALEMDYIEPEIREA